MKSHFFLHGKTKFTEIMEFVFLTVDVEFYESGREARRTAEIGSTVRSARNEIEAESRRLKLISAHVLRLDVAPGEKMGEPKRHFVSIMSKPAGLDFLMMNVMMNVMKECANSGGGSLLLNCYLSS